MLLIEVERFLYIEKAFCVFFVVVVVCLLAFFRAALAAYRSSQARD